MIFTTRSEQQKVKGSQVNLIETQKDESPKIRKAEEVIGDQVKKKKNCFKNQKGFWDTHDHA